MYFVLQIHLDQTLLQFMSAVHWNKYVSMSSAGNTLHFKTVCKMQLGHTFILF